MRCFLSLPSLTARSFFRSCEALTGFLGWLKERISGTTCVIRTVGCEVDPVSVGGQPSASSTMQNNGAAFAAPLLLVLTTRVYGSIQTGSFSDSV